MSSCAASENAIEVVVTENDIEPVTEYVIEVVTENDTKVVTENDIEPITENANEVVTENDTETVHDNDIKTVFENDIEIVSEIENEVSSETAINVIPGNSIKWMKPHKRKKLRKLLPARKTQKVIGISYDSKYILNKGRKNWKKFTFPNSKVMCH